MKQYLVDTPPPTLSGKLHIGHIFGYSQAQYIINYKRLMGYDVYHPFGIDCNGIPTLKLAKKENNRLDTNSIVKLANQINYRNQFKDFNILFNQDTYYTINSKNIADKAFNILLEKGLVYQSEEECYVDNQGSILSNSELKEGIEYNTTTINSWFINIVDFKEQLKNKVNEINWHPTYYKKQCLNWIDQLDRNWSISRKREFGVQILDTDLVYDTWFISALTPILGLYNDFQEPPIYDLRYQGHDIIRTWAFYTIVMSYHLFDKIPWKDIMITGHVLSNKHSKISKSENNGGDLHNFLINYGIDNIKNWTIFTLGEDKLINDQELRQGRRLRTKLINAERFIDLQLTDNKLGEDSNIETIALNEIKEIENLITSFDIINAKLRLQSLFWDTFCSTWIEQSKKTPINLSLKRILAKLKPLILLQLEQ